MMSAIVQTGITLLAVGLAAAYLTRNLVRNLRGGGDSKCHGCSALGAGHIPAERQRLSASKEPVETKPVKLL